MRTATLRDQRAILRGVAHLSVGSAMVQGLAAASQIVFALWLAPADFGYWAAASSSVAVLTGMVNFGEVNGYLANADSGIRESRRVIWRINSLLMLGGVGVSVSYFLADQTTIALLVVFSSVNLPLLGQSNLLYAVYLKQRRNTSLVRAQALSALLRTAVGVSVAWVTGSAFAFAVSMLCYSIVIIALLASPMRSWPKVSPEKTARASWHDRAKWSVHSLSQMLPSQADFLVVSFLAAPALLGIYFLSYQITAGVSGLVAGPLAKSALSTLSSTDEKDRLAFAVQLMSLVSGLAGVAACAGVIVATLASPVVPSSWQGTAVTISLLLASLPARFLALLTDSLLISSSRWWRGATLNGVDTVGTGVASVAALTGDVRWLASSVVAWKVAFATIRVRSSLRGERSLGRLSVVGPGVFVAACITAGAVLGAPHVWALVGLALSGSVVQLLWCARLRLPVRRSFAAWSDEDDHT